MSAKHIMVIDDEGYWLEMMQMLLDRLGYESTLVENSKEGLKLLKANPHGYEVVLLDLMMPMMSGIDFLKERGKDESLSHIPIILQTGSQNHHVIKEAIDAGAHSLLQKPFNLSALAAVLEAA